MLTKLRYEWEWRQRCEWEWIYLVLSRHLFSSIHFHHNYSWIHRGIVKLLEIRHTLTFENTHGLPQILMHVFSKLVQILHKRNVSLPMLKKAVISICLFSLCFLFVYFLYVYLIYLLIYLLAHFSGSITSRSIINSISCSNENSPQYWNYICSVQTASDFIRIEQTTVC